MRNKELEELRRTVEMDFNILQTKFKDLEEAQVRKKDLQIQQDNLNLILAYFNKLVDKKRKEVMDKVINLVSFGLQSVFQNPSMKLLVKERLQRNQKFYTIAIETDGVVTENWDDASGGVRDITQFMLRVVLTVVSSNRRFIVLDEPFRGVSAEYRENLGEFLRYLSNQLGIQFLIVSHQVEIDSSADKLYSIRKVENDVKILQVETAKS